MHSTGCEKITNYIIEKINELNEKYEIDPEVMKATLAFLDCGEHPPMPLIHHTGYWYQHAMKTFFGIKSDEDWDCEQLAELPNWDVRTASPMDINDRGDGFIATLGHLHFTLKGERDLAISIKLDLEKLTYRPEHLFIESWPFGEISGCMEVHRYFKVNEETKTKVFDFLKELETHECHEYCNSEKFPYDEEE